MKTPFSPFSHLLLIILICISTTPSQAQGNPTPKPPTVQTGQQTAQAQGSQALPASGKSTASTGDQEYLDQLKESLASFGDASTALKARREAASFERTESFRRMLTGEATGLTGEWGELDGLSCAERAVKRAHLLRNIQLAKEEVVRRALTGSYPCECFTQPDIVELIRKTRLYGTAPGGNIFTEQMKNMDPDEIYLAACQAKNLAGNWKNDIDRYVAKLRQKAKTNSTSAAELAEYEELTIKRRDNELGINISILKKVSMTPGDIVRQINRQYIKKKQAPLYQKPYFMAFDEKYKRTTAATEFSADRWSAQMMRSAIGYPQETDSRWSPSTIIGSLIHFFSLLP